MSKQQTLAYMRKKRFGGLWEEVMNRDGWKCRGCGITNEEHLKRYGISLTIDHMDGRGRYVDMPNNTLENLQILCLRCHGAKDGWKNGKYSEYGISLGLKFEIIRREKPTAGLN